jgi:transcriptional regulator with XRE-family HTH domain
VAGASPTVQRRRLGTALRALRETCGLTGEQAGQAIERSASWISRVEGGRMGIRARDLRDLLDLYDVTDRAKRDDLLQLAEEGRARGWWSRYSASIPEAYATLIGLESEASRLEIFESNVVPGLLQTAEYARNVIRNGLLVLDEASIEERAQIRIRRQEILTRNDPVQLSIVSSEAILERQFGDREIMRDQLRHLEAMVERENIDVRIVRNADVPPVTTAGYFTMIYFSTPDPEIVYFEDLTGGKFEEGEAVRLYQQVFSRFTAQALNAQQSLERIRKAAASYAH